MRQGAGKRGKGRSILTAAGLAKVTAAERAAMTVETFMVSDWLCSGRSLIVFVDEVMNLPTDDVIGRSLKLWIGLIGVWCCREKVRS